MAPNGYDRTELETPESREIVAQQLADMQAAVGAADFTWDTEAPADYGLLFVPGRLLVDEQDVEDLHRVFEERGGEIPGGVPEPVGRGGERELSGTLTYEHSDRANREPREILATLQAINEGPLPDRRPDRADLPLVTLEHWVHVAANGDGRACPATEPEVADREKAFPDAETDEGVGKAVKVVVIDTGYVDQPGVAGDPNRELREYDGHGSFIEGVIKSRAPGVDVHHLPYPVHLATQHSGGVVSEYELARLLGDALDMDPDIINISAGCHRINNQPFEGFRNQWRKRPEAQRQKVAVIAAAGNDRSPDPFFPAANEFAIGVGSLDRTGGMSFFSNYNRSADVFVLGRKHVNRFPKGRYTCRWRPHRGQPRVFTTGWAEWSGTSFAAPLFAGLVAAKMTREGSMARQAADDLVNNIAQPGLAGEPFGPYPVIDLDSPLY